MRNRLGGIIIPTFYQHQQLPAHSIIWCQQVVRPRCVIGTEIGVGTDAMLALFRINRPTHYFSHRVDTFQ